jgi:hypothetical protein
VRCDQLLLLVQRADEAECLRAESHDRDDRQHNDRAEGATQNTRALTPSPWGEHQEGEHQSRRCLHADPHDHQRGRRTHVRARPACLRGRRVFARRRALRRQQQRARQHQQHERVVVSAPDRQLEQHGVQADERSRVLRRAAHLARRARRQPDRAEAREHTYRLQRPQSAAKPQWRERIGAEREQRTVGRVLKRPPDEREHRVGRCFGGDVRVRVKAVQHAHARKREITEHVLGEQRRSQQQHDVRQQDRCHDRAHGQRSGREQHRDVARAHHERERLEAVRSDSQPETVQRSRQPPRPAAATGGHVLRRLARRAARHGEHARRHPHQADHPERTQRRRGSRFGPRSRLRRASVRRWR